MRKIQKIKDEGRKLKNIMLKNKKRKALSLLLLIYLSYSFSFVIYNYEPITNHTSIYGADISVYNTDAAYKGYNVFMLGKVFVNPITYLLGGSDIDAAISSAATYLIVMDMEGNVILSREINYSGTAGSLIGGISPVEKINETTISVANNTGCYLWNLRTNVEKQLNISGHHELEWNSNNNTLFTFHQNTYHAIINGDNKTITSDSVIEYNLDGNIVWNVDLEDYLKLDWICPYLETPVGEPIDFTHANSIYYDSNKDVLYCNVRNLNTILAIDHKTKDLIWSVGEHGNFTMYNINGVKTNILFSHSHGLELVGDNTFITFDNDVHNPNKAIFSGLIGGNTLDTFLCNSRIVEFTLNINSMTANETFVWTAPAYAYTPMWGNAYRFPNGNRFGTFGAPNVFKRLGLITDKGPQLIEVNENGQIVWKATFKSTDGELYGIYRCLRLAYDTWKFLEGY